MYLCIYDMYVCRGMCDLYDLYVYVSSVCTCAMVSMHYMQHKLCWNDMCAYKVPMHGYMYQIHTAQAQNRT